MYQLDNSKPICLYVQQGHSLTAHSLSTIEEVAEVILSIPGSSIHLIHIPCSDGLDRAFMVRKKPTGNPFHYGDEFSGWTAEVLSVEDKGSKLIHNSFGGVVSAINSFQSMGGRASSGAKFNCMAERWGEVGEIAKVSQENKGVFVSDGKDMYFTTCWKETLICELIRIPVEGDNIEE